MTEFAPGVLTALVLTALPVEMTAVLAHVSAGGSAKIVGPVLCEIRHFSVSEGLSWQVIAAEVGPGTVDTASAVAAVTSRLQPDVVMFVGIAGALRDDVHVGDVVAGTEVAWTERGRWSQGGYLPRVRTVSLSRPLSQLARKIARDGDWTRRLARPGPGVKAVVGQIASGDKVVADKEYRTWLQAAFSDALAIENEGFGLARAAEACAQGQRYVVRGISDNADGSKSDDGQRVAADAAAAFAFDLLDAYSDAVAAEVTAGQGFGQRADGSLPGILGADRGLGGTTPVASISSQIPHAAAFSTAIGQFGYQPWQETDRAVSVPPRPVFLVGREELLTKLDAMLTEAGRQGPRIIVLHGLTGAGKTSLAVECAHRHLSTDGVLWLFPAENPLVLAAEFARLAAQLGGWHLADARDPVASVHAALATSPVPWMLVFDNAESHESVSAFLPPAGNGIVLITSQNALWPPGHALEVPALSGDSAAAFLAVRTGDPDGQDAADLAAELGGLPLALEQAAAYIQATGETLVDYLADFRERRAELLSRGEPTAYSKTVATTWSLAFERLERQSPTATGLLRLLACCAPEPFPIHLVLTAANHQAARLNHEVADMLRPLLGDSLAVRDAVAALRHYSLITLAGDQLVLMHRLVRAVVLDQMPHATASRWRRVAAKLIAAAIPADARDSDSWPACATLLPHAQATVPPDSQGMARIARYLGCSGSYSAARDLWADIAAARERALGPRHADTLLARYWLAYWTGQAGAPAAARDQFTTLVPACQQILGAEHPDTLTAVHSLASWTGTAGDPATARDQLTSLLHLQERVLGKEHPEALSTRHSLAFWTGKAGDPAAARNLFAELLRVRERLLGYDDPDTLNTRHNVALWTGKAGNPAAARDMFADLLPVRKRVLGADHPRTLNTRHNLALWTGKAGNPAAARDMFADLLPVRKRVLGAGHPDTLESQRNLAYWTRQAADRH